VSDLSLIEGYKAFRLLTVIDFFTIYQVSIRARINGEYNITDETKNYILS
jgi:hypothetical protein